MTVNLPFSKLAFAAGSPLFVSSHADELELEQARREVERSLDEVTSRAHALSRSEATGRRSKPPHPRES
jgi:3-deoxy-D-manno-octulosonic-acid transferase